MASPVRLPDEFAVYLRIPNAPQRFEEALVVADRITAAEVPLHTNPDHAAIFCDPPQLVAGPLKRLGYVCGWDARCYPSPVDGCDYINVSAKLPAGSAARERGWFDYVAIVHPVDPPALQQMLSQGVGNPFIHHLTWGIVPQQPSGQDDFEYAGRLVSQMVNVRATIGRALESEPGTLIIALPQAVIDHPGFARSLPAWLGDLPRAQYQVEPMQGGGFLIQFFVFEGGRIEVALRVDTTQTFNPKSVHKISKDEISTIQE